MEDSKSIKVQIKQIVAEYTTKQFEFNNPILIDTPKICDNYLVILTESELTLQDCPKKAGDRRSLLNFTEMTVLRLRNLHLVRKTPSDDPKSLKIQEVKPNSRKTFEFLFKTKDSSARSRRYSSGSVVE